MIFVLFFSVEIKRNVKGKRKIRDSENPGQKSLQKCWYISKVMEYLVEYYVL